MDLSYNNATGALSCDNVNPTLLALDLSHNGHVITHRSCAMILHSCNLRYVKPCLVVHCPAFLQPCETFTRPIMSSGSCSHHCS
jgi:hypothetical protein